MNSMSIHEVLKYLPQRYPFILIDQVLSYELGQSLVAIKNVSANEPYFAGHFPSNPIMPGVLILESMAQASIILANISERKVQSNDVMHVFAGIDKARFRAIVSPGDQLQLEVKLIKAKRDIWKMSATALVDQKVVCSAELMSAAKDVHHDQ